MLDLMAKTAHSDILTWWTSATFVSNRSCSSDTFFADTALRLGYDGAFACAQVATAKLRTSVRFAFATFHNASARNWDATVSLAASNVFDCSDTSRLVGQAFSLNGLALLTRTSFRVASKTANLPVETVLAFALTSELGATP